MNDNLVSSLEGKSEIYCTGELVRTLRVFVQPLLSIVVHTV